MLDINVYEIMYDFCKEEIDQDILDILKKIPNDYLVHSQILYYSKIGLFCFDGSGTVKISSLNKAQYRKNEEEVLYIYSPGSKDQIKFDITDIIKDNNKLEDFLFKASALSYRCKLYELIAYNMLAKNHHKIYNSADINNFIDFQEKLPSGFALKSFNWIPYNLYYTNYMAVAYLALKDIIPFSKNAKEVVNEFEKDYSRFHADSSLSYNVETKTFKYLNDLRISLLIHYSHSIGWCLNIYFSYPENPEYNYMDTGRVLVHDNNYTNVLLSFPTMSYNDFKNLKLKTSELNTDRLKAIETESIISISRANLKLYIDMDKILTEKAKDVKNVLFEKLLTTFKKTNSIKINDFTITDRFFQYQNFKVWTDSTNLPNMAQVLTYFLNEINYNLSGVKVITLPNIIELFTFNEFYELYIREVVKDLYMKYNNHKTNIVVNNINICIEKITKNKISTYKINNKKVNFEDVRSCLMRALSYSSKEEYDQFLSKISKLGFELHKILDAGVTAKLRLSELVTIDLLFNVEKLKSGYRVSTDTFSIQVKNARNFKRAIDKSNNAANYTYNLQHLVSAFYNNKNVLEEIDEFLINQLIIDGKKYHSIRQSKLTDSFKLIENLTKAEFAENITINSNTYSGYFINSSSNKKYFIDKDGSKGIYKIWKVLPNKFEYVCVVDRTPGEQGLDKLMTRMLAIFNDNHLKNEVNTF